MATIGDLTVKLQADTRQFERRMSMASQLTQGFARKAKTAGIAFGVGMAAATASAVLLVKSVGELAQKIGEMSDEAKKFGISLEALQRLQYAAKLSGVEAGTLQGGLTKLTKSLIEAKDEGSSAAVALDKLGLSAEALASMGIDEAYTAIGSAIKDVGSQSEQAEIAFALFGKTGIDQLNALRENITGFQAEFDQLGLTLTDSQVSAVEGFGDSIDRFEAMWSGLKNQVVAALADPFSQFISDIQKAIIEMGGLRVVAKDISTFLIAAFKNVASVVGQMVKLINEARRAVVATKMIYQEMKDSFSGLKLPGQGSGFSLSSTISPDAIQSANVETPKISSEYMALSEEYKSLTTTTDRYNSVLENIMSKPQTALKSYVPTIEKVNKATEQLSKTMVKSNDMISGMIDGMKNERVGSELNRILGADINAQFGGLSRTEMELNKNFSDEVRQANPTISEESLQKLLPFQESRPDTTYFDELVRGIFSQVQGGQLSTGEFNNQLENVQGLSQGMGLQFQGVVEELRKFGENAGLVSKDASKLEIKVTADKGFALELMNSENVKAYIQGEANTAVAMAMGSSATKVGR